MNLRAIFWLVVIVFVIGRAIKKSVEGAAAQQKAETEDETYAASPEEVREFLRGLGPRPAPRVQAPAAGGAGIVRDVLAALGGESVAAAERPRIARPAPWEAEKSRPAATRAPARSPRRPRRPRREEQPRPPTAERPPSRRPEAPPVIPGRPGGRGGTPLRFALRGRDLRKAIVWAEVLGPPVSLRRSRRPALPPRE